MSSSEPWKSASEPPDAPAGTNWLPPSAATGAAFAAAAEELDGVGDDLDRLALRAVLGIPLAPFEPAVDPDRPSLGEVLRAALALVAPDGDVEVVRLLQDQWAADVRDFDSIIEERKFAEVGSFATCLASTSTGSTDRNPTGRPWPSATRCSSHVRRALADRRVPPDGSR